MTLNILRLFLNYAKMFYYLSILAMISISSSVRWLGVVYEANRNMFK